MEQVTVSSKGQVAIPKNIREALNVSAGTKLTIEVRGHEIVLSKGSDWRKLQGSLRDPGFMEWFAAEKKKEREREDARARLLGDR